MLLLAAFCLGMASHLWAAPPNILLIIADDQGYGDFGFMGNPLVRTPHIDDLASRSARFVNGYVPNSLCRPSLATLLTRALPPSERRLLQPPLFRSAPYPGEPASRQLSGAPGGHPSAPALPGRIPNPANRQALGRRFRQRGLRRGDDPGQASSGREGPGLCGTGHEIGARQRRRRTDDRAADAAAHL